MLRSTIAQSTAPDLKAAAVDYASTHGWRVLPVRSKQPLFSRWQHKASADVATILSWPLWERADGLGLATGVGSRLIVLDVDGPKGEETIARFRREGRAFPETWEQRTGRDDGGRHLFFRTNDRLSKRSFKEDGLDIQAEGAQVVAAPSLHPSGRRYESLPNDLAPAPEWLCEMAGEATEGPNGGIDESGLPWKIKKALKAEKGQRSKSLFIIYRWGIDSGLPDPDIITLVRANPVGSKVEGLSDPDGWLLKDIDRFRAQNVESIGFSPAEHIELTMAYLGKLSTPKRKLIVVIQDLAIAHRNKEVTVSRGELAVRASMGETTVKDNLKKLVDQDHLLSRVGGTRGGRLANAYRLRVPPVVVKALGEEGVSSPAPPPAPLEQPVGRGARDDTPRDTPLSPTRMDPSHDAARWGALGSSWKYLDILDVPKSRRELQNETGAERRTVLRNLASLIDRGLVVRNADFTYQRAEGWEARLDEVARESGTTGRKEEAARQLAAEREWRRMERVQYARSNGVKWKGLSPFDPLTGEILPPDDEEPVREVVDGLRADQQTTAAHTHTGEILADAIPEPRSASTTVRNAIECGAGQQEPAYGELVNTSTAADEAEESAQELGTVIFLGAPRREASSAQCSTAMAA
ncbi:bifunctional DNA primase/polymerase [Streptomyces coelicoflavus]|uniref:bifunctional DNA primase/polymerase n=1 Tax=Streptomyces coelicoflavus TaxID=285562 RepID=UPI003683EBC0